ncbi:C-type lectin 37Db [Drosophila erecta]|uniref:C-type lectin domain-containing protein n=1 Tax=Drosophila erecta TaxID=7220 RepID=B3N384_DROER|nr:C-type lectin 37Db [Drosophila erecta]EDV57683.1 uncharacterized protein Dere_GG24400 [Drosophila erecta]
MAQIQNVVLAFSSQLHELNEKLEQMETTLRKSYIPPGFDLIGTRYFYIEHYDRKNWTDAGIACQQKGGYLAAFKSQEELEELHKELQLAVYWLGINEREKEGQFVSVASGKAVEYFDWMLDEPFNWQDIKQECVALTLGKMTDVECSREFHYICQLDNKI